MLCVTGPWIGYRAESIALDAWLDRWSPGLEKDNRHVAVFPAPDNKGVIVEPRQFEATLRDELAHYE